MCVPPAWIQLFAFQALKTYRNFLSGIYKYPVKKGVKILESDHSLAGKSQDKWEISEYEVLLRWTQPTASLTVAPSLRDGCLCRWWAFCPRVSWTALWGAPHSPSPPALFPPPPDWVWGLLKLRCFWPWVENSSCQVSLPIDTARL